MTEFVVYMQIDTTGSPIRLRGYFLNKIGLRQQNPQLARNTARLGSCIICTRKDVSDRVHKTFNSRCHFRFPVFDSLVLIIGSR